MLVARKRTPTPWIIIACLALIATAIWWPLLQNHESQLDVFFLDVGQGDCTFIRTPSGRTILIDGGGRPERPDFDSVGTRIVEPFLRSRGVNRIDLLVLTHPHDDHAQGLISVARDFKVEMVLDSAQSHTSLCYRRFLEIVARRHIPYKRAVRGQVFDFGDGVRALVLNPPDPRIENSPDTANDNSIVLRFTYGSSALVMTGDASRAAEQAMIESGLPLRADVLKVGHHGSPSATGEDWLDAVRPRIAVISVGANNSFGHPSLEILSRLTARGITIYRTDRDGAVFLKVSPNSVSSKGFVPAHMGK